MNGRSFLKRLISVIFPPLCVNCRRRMEDGALCGNCENLIEIRSGFACPECGRRLPEAGNVCHEKAKFILAAAAPYENPAVRELICALKYQRMKTVLEPISKITSRYIEKTIGNPKFETGNFVLISIPLHPEKERERGFNQAVLIARIVNDKLGIGVQENNLIRVRRTSSQTKTKSYEEREKNVKDIKIDFRVNEIKNPELVAGKNVILVDDVFTSGATMKEAVRVLKNAGARKIIGFVVAKA